MRYCQLGWLILGIIFFAENGRRTVVSGMPLDNLGGSMLCRLNFRSIPSKEERPRIAFELLYRDITSVPDNSSKCSMEFWNEATSLDMRQGNKRSFDRFEVRLTRENSELFKIFVDKGAQDWFETNANSIVHILCPSRKFNCIRFRQTEKGASHVRRSLLSIEQLYTYEDSGDSLLLKPLILVLAGAVILVVAGSLCANCDKTKDNESVSEARPQLVACQQRISQRKSTPEEQEVQEQVVFESKDVVIETAEKIEGDSVEANNHKPQTTIAHYELPPNSVQRELPYNTQLHEPPCDTQNVPSSDAQNVPPSSTQHVPRSSTHHEPQISTQALVPDTEPRAQSDIQPVQPNDSQLEPEAGARTSRASKAGSTKKKRGSEHDLEEHKGKFWKRTRSSKGSNSTSGAARAAVRTSGSAQHGDRTSDVVSKDEEHKKRRSGKKSREQKDKSGKTKGRTGSTDSEGDEKIAFHDDHFERPREATPTLERHSRELPALPSSSGPALPVRPVPQRQLSAPDGTEEDNNYDTVEPVRKTKSMERFKAAPKPADDTYDSVQDKVGKPRLPSLDNETVDERGTGAQTDIYDEVITDTTNAVEVDSFYTEVPEPGNKEGKKIDVKSENMVEDEDVDEEDPYSKIKYPNIEEETENSELYEDIEQGNESRDKKHKYAKVNKGEVFRLMIENDANTESNDRNRSQSDAAVLQRSGNEIPKRPNTIHVIRSTKGEVTSAPFEYTYAEVDLSKKTRQPRNTEGGESTEVENWDSDNPPPLPPAYVSSRQIQIEMEKLADSSIDNKDNLYDEVASTSERDRALNMELLTPDDESKRLSSVSGDYELVEVPPKPFRMTADDYTEVIEREPRPKVGSGRSGPPHVYVCGAPSNVSVTVTSSSKAVDNNVDDEEIPHYETVALPKERKKRPSLSDGEWL